MTTDTVASDTVASQSRGAGSFAWLSVVLALLAVAVVGAGLAIDRAHPQPGRPVVAPLEQAAATVVPVAVTPAPVTPMAAPPEPAVVALPPAPAAPPPVVRPAAQTPRRVVVTPRRVRPAPVVPVTRTPTRTSRRDENVGSDDSGPSDQRKHGKKHDRSGDSRSDGGHGDSGDSSDSSGQDGDTSS